MMSTHMQRNKPLKVDFLVLGCGIAGVRAAIELARAGHVLVLTKGELSISWMRKGSPRGTQPWRIRTVSINS